MKNKNQDFIINDSDKNLGAAAAEKKDVITECTRQLYDISTYFQLSLEEAELLIAKIKMELLEVVNKYTLEKECKPNEAHFLLSKTKVFTIPHFYIIIYEFEKLPQTLRTLGRRLIISLKFRK